MEVDYKRVSDSDGEMTLSFTDCKELMRFLRITNCRSFALSHRDSKSLSGEPIAVYNRYKGKWYDRRYRNVSDLEADLRRMFKKYGALCLTQKNTNEYLLGILKSLKQMDVA